MGQRQPFEEISRWDAATKKSVAMFYRDDANDVFTYRVPKVGLNLNRFVERYYPGERDAAWGLVLKLNNLVESPGQDVQVSPPPPPRPKHGQAQSPASPLQYRKELTLPLLGEDRRLLWERYLVSHDKFSEVCDFLRDDHLRNRPGDTDVDPRWFTEDYLKGRVLNAELNDLVLADDHHVLPWRKGGLGLWVPYDWRLSSTPPARVPPVTVTRFTNAGAVEKNTIQLLLREAPHPGRERLVYDARDWVRRHGSHDRAHGGWLTQCENKVAERQSVYLLPHEWAEGCYLTCTLMLGLKRVPPHRGESGELLDKQIVRGQERPVCKTAHKGLTRADAASLDVTGGSTRESDPDFNREPHECDKISEIERDQREDVKGHVIPDRNAYDRMVQYIDDQLVMGRPVIVGVSVHRDKDAVKDHYVVIVARGRDTEDYWLYYDPAIIDSRGTDVKKNRFKRQFSPSEEPGAAREGVLYNDEIYEWGDAKFYEVCEYYLNDDAVLTDGWVAREKGDLLPSIDWTPYYRAAP